MFKRRYFNTSKPVDIEDSPNYLYESVTLKRSLTDLEWENPLQTKGAIHFPKSQRFYAIELYPMIAGALHGAAACRSCMEPVAGW